MATFKVGQRVKKVAHRTKRDIANAVLIVRAPLGSVGVVDGFDGDYVLVLYDDPRFRGFFGDSVRVLPYQIAPLTPPRETEWAESKVRDLLRLVKEPLPLHPSEV